MTDHTLQDLDLLGLGDMFAHEFVDVGGARLHAVTGGEGDPVVLLHGFPEDWSEWAEVLPVLAQDHRVVALDLPGQGLSSRPAAGYDTATVSRRVHEAVQRLAGDRYHLVCHDVGAWVGLTYALLFGDEVAGLVLLDAGIPGATLPERISLDPVGARKLWHFAFHQVPDLPEILLEGKEREYLTWFFREKPADPATFDEAQIDRYTRGFVRDNGVRAALAYYRELPRSAAANRELLARGKLTMPVLAVDAEFGSIPDMAAPLQPFAALPVMGAHIKGAGHFIPEERPEALLTALLPFLAAAGATSNGATS